MDFTHEELKILQEAIDHYGKKNQLNVAIEEMAELTKLICKQERIVCPHEFFTNKEILDIFDNFYEEIADVLIMLEQLMMMFDCEERVSAIASEKIRRLKARINNGE